MAMLLTPDGTVVGCRINGTDYPVTPANVARAVAVQHCVTRYGPVLDSGLTAFEFDRFCEETGLPPHERHTRIIVRQLYHWAVGREDVVACAVTIAPEEALAPVVERPVATAARRLRAAQQDQAALGAVCERAGRVLRRLGSLPQRTFRTLGHDEAYRLIESATAQARLALSEGADGRGWFRIADEEILRAGRAARELRVGIEGAAAEAAVAAAVRAQRCTGLAAGAVAQAEELYGELRRAGEPPAGGLRRVPRW